MGTSRKASVFSYGIASTKRGGKKKQKSSKVFAGIFDTGRCSNRDFPTLLLQCCTKYPLAATAPRSLQFEPHRFIRLVRSSRREQSQHVRYDYQRAQSQLTAEKQHRRYQVHLCRRRRPLMLSYPATPPFVLVE